VTGRVEREAESTTAGRFRGQVALVTGSGSGIGEAIARRLASEGASVAVVDRDIAAAERVALAIEQAGARAVPHETDVSIGGQVEEMVATVEEVLGSVDVLVNNVAIANADGLIVTEESAWDEELAVDLKSVFLCCKYVLPSMVERPGGAIVNIASVNGLGYFGLEAYSAAKAGVISLTKAAAVRYGPYGIRVNAVAPGSVRTPAWQQFIDKDPELFERLLKWYPLGRIGDPDDVAKAVAFLASSDAAWITGTVLQVDGGLLAGNGVMARELLARTSEPFAPIAGV
jgi:meso-butanediol dehydrogenase/(S,S)-butanediol dehydrogenase/diacetyl reductase